MYLNVPPFTALFRAIYTLGVHCVVARLARHATIHSILGHGSYFRGTALYGNSDVDLVIVLRRDSRRTEGVQYPIAKTYNAVRRFFPFLGSWDEKEGSLIFLDEIENGFPPHSTFRIRMWRGEFELLHGQPFPPELRGEPLSAADWLLEIDRLLRWAVAAGEDFAQRELFWERTFAKLEIAARELGVEYALAGTWARPELAFLGRPARTLYFEIARPDELLSRFLECVHAVFAAVRAIDDDVRLDLRPISGGAPVPESIDTPVFAACDGVSNARAVSSIAIGLQPRLFYFSVDEPIVVVDLSGSPYRSLKALLERMEDEGKPSDAVIAHAGGMLFLFSCEADFVDIVPLNPLLCANVYAWVDGRTEFSMPADVHRAALAEAEALFAALRDAYRRHAGHLPKHSTPAIYREDDIDTIRDALDILRAHVGYVHRLAITSSADLVEFLSDRHPRSKEFLGALLDYREYLERGRRGRPPANNLYRCLHKFVAEVLDGAEDIEISDHEARIGITVGIITRNRAGDLRNALESLTMQERVPDEVLVLDNGSSDETKAVIDGFERHLPLRYLYLAEASIPRARNLVLEHATQEVVAFTDDDCAIPREWLGSVERGFLRADNVGIVGGWVEHWPAPRRTTVDAYYEIFHNHKT